MTDLVRLALSLAALAATISEAEKKHEFHGHALDKDRLRWVLAQIVTTCRQIEEAIDDDSNPG